MAALVIDAVILNVLATLIASGTVISHSQITTSLDPLAASIVEDNLVLVSLISPPLNTYSYPAVALAVGLTLALALVFTSWTERSELSANLREIASPYLSKSLRVTSTTNWAFLLIAIS